MSVTLRGSVMVGASIERTWSALIDWHGQEDWIPMTTMRVIGERSTGIGTRIKAFHGLRLGPLPLGLIDNFVVTDWQQPTTVEVLHLGPYFTGVGLFELAFRGDEKTWVSVVEVFDLPLAKVTEVGARLANPVLHVGLQASLRTFARTVEQGA
ncbi:hypothetical protein FHX74_002111 [Friedmanniella endophytica]|uniref:Polyketide cyclase / dehydrase and lipid transport n=1 Tax=Microlunatus kandeliicorticis TaxID=1759536 RepID=A0A7W3ISM0_9ACTN|nr:SRPBCC family protein [Microlunatus kandeliicorticis]MBA8794492.1 hypothetical protein [Microlunatus kandeliicorticis]